MEDAIEEYPRVFEAGWVRLRDFGRDAPGFTYVYDFGDNWRHLVTLEDELHLDPPLKAARCMAGARARPPEDVGGVSGYAYFLDILADPDDHEHSETLRGCGGYFDPEWLDLERINKDLRNTLRANARRPRDQPKPRKT